MQTIESLYETIQSLDTDTICEASVKNTSDAIADLNAEQLFHGLSSKEKNLKSYRNEEYAEEKNRMNPLPGFGNPDLYYTGNFYKGIKATVDGSQFTITSSDEKTPMLTKKYGDKIIFGLGEKYSGEYIREFLNPEFKKQMESATGIKLNG
jgi:hypothetical protein